MKRKRLLAAFMALTLCAALTACGDSADEESSVRSASRREEASPAAEDKADDGEPEQADGSEDEAGAETTAAATEATTTAAETTTQPQVVEFTPLIEAGGEITTEVLEQFMPYVFGLPLQEAVDAIITSLNLTTYSTEFGMGQPGSSTAPEGMPFRWIGEINLREAPISMQGLDLVCISVNTYMTDDIDPIEDPTVKQYTAELAFAFTKEGADDEAYDEARAAVYQVFTDATGIGSVMPFNYTDVKPYTYSVFLSKYPKKTEE